MVHMLVRHQVTNFEAWKKAYDENAGARKAAGLKELHLWRNIENSSDVMLLFEAADLNKAKKFIMSKDLAGSMTRSGVRGQPEILFLGQ